MCGACVSTRPAGSNLRRDRTPGAPSGDERGKTCIARPGTLGSNRVAERHAKKARLANDPSRAADLQRRRSSGPGRWRACQARVHQPDGLVRRTSGSVPPVAPARTIEDLRHEAGQQAVYPPPRTVGCLMPTRERPIRLERPGPRVRHASIIATRPLQRKTAGATLISPAGSYSHERGPVQEMKRRSGIVRRLAAPDSASEASERCRGRKPQERRPTCGGPPTPGILCRRGARAGSGRSCEMKAGRVRGALR